MLEAYVKNMLDRQSHKYGDARNRGENMYSNEDYTMMSITVYINQIYSLPCKAL